MNYPTPFPREEAAERLFAKSLLEPNAQWLLLGRQFQISGGPERLDLLALDRDAVPWIFEFKRDIATEEAVGQLLSYGAFVAPLSRGHLADMFAEQHKNLTLSEAFQNQVGCKLPERLSGRVNLVLAAFVFSDRCNRVILFLERGAGLVIGQMHSQFKPDTIRPRFVDFNLIKPPKPSLPISQPIGNAQPEEYFLLFVEETDLALPWDECRERNLIVLRDGQIRRHRAPGPSSGLFVYLRSHGLVGYGIVAKRGRLLLEAESLNGSAEGEDPPPVQAELTWQAQVIWHRTHPFGDAVPTITSLFPVQSGLFKITNPDQLLDFQASIGVD
ncbi:MAG: hypothetical protein ABSF38_01325 [Verrucomicrobiota bacterium]